MLAHVHVMKTGGQTVCDILRQSFPGNHCDLQSSNLATPRDLEIALRYYPQMKSISGHGVRPLAGLEEVCDSLRYFAFLRDPVSRCVSHYQFLRRKNALTADFRSWITGFANYQTRFLTGSPTSKGQRVCTAEQAIDVLEERVGFVGLLEKFNESLVLLRAWSQEESLDIRYRARNIATDNRIKQELLADPDAMALIHECHEEDQKLYRYAVDVMYARQVDQFQGSLDVDVANLRHSTPNAGRIIATAMASLKRNMLYKPAVRRAA